MKLRPKKIVDKLARPGIIVRRLVFENEVCKYERRPFVRSFIR